MEFRGIKSFLFLLIFLLFSSKNNTQTETLTTLTPPSPKKIPMTFQAHGVERVDHYYWMRDDSRKDKKVLNYLKSENKHLYLRGVKIIFQITVLLQFVIV